MCDREGVGFQAVVSERVETVKICVTCQDELYGCVPVRGIWPGFCASKGRVLEIMCQ